MLGSPGDVELLVDNIHVSGAAPSVRALRSLVPMSLVTIAAGARPGRRRRSSRRAARSRVGSRAGARLSVDDARCLTIAGMAAAFTVLFAAPLGSALFALEILHRRGMQYYEALVPAIVGSLSGYACYLVLTGTGAAPVWRIPGVDACCTDRPRCGRPARVWRGAAIAVGFTYLTLGLRRVFARDARA